MHPAVSKIGWLAGRPAGWLLYWLFLLWEAIHIRLYIQAGTQRNTNVHVFSITIRSLCSLPSMYARVLRLLIVCVNIVSISQLVNKKYQISVI